MPKIIKIGQCFTGLLKQ